MKANEFGNQSGDEQRHNKEGNFIIPKIEIHSSSGEEGSGNETIKSKILSSSEERGSGVETIKSDTS